LALHDVELDAIALGKALEAPALDRRMMDKAVLATILGRDESEALGVIEPLDFSCVAHSVLFSLSVATKKTETCSNQASVEMLALMPVGQPWRH
jgi:hypothetical protein